MWYGIFRCNMSLQHLPFYPVRDTFEKKMLTFGRIWLNFRLGGYTQRCFPFYVIKTSTVLLSTTALLFWYKGTILHPIWELAPIIRYQLQIKCQMTTTYCESIACFVEEKNLMHFILFDILINFPTCRFMLMDILQRFPFRVKASAKPISLTNFTKASASI